MSLFGNAVGPRNNDLSLARGKFIHRFTLLVFFSSGISALIYQVAWIRQFMPVFGITILAVSTVIAVFMAGLALGSFLFGRFVDKSRQPLRIFAYLQLGIGTSAVAVPFLIVKIQSIYIFTYRLIDADFLTLTIIRLLLSFLVLLIPTTLMGGTLPVLGKFYINKFERLGKDVGSLYSINTLGAIVGALIAGFFLIEILGVKETIYVAAVISLSIGFISLMLPKMVGVDRSEKPKRVSTKRTKGGEPDYSNSTREKDYSANVTYLVLIVFGIQGFISMGYEIIWIKILASSTLVNSVYSFSIVLISFLLGLALGSYLFSRFVDTKKGLVWLFGIVEASIGLSAILLLPLFSKFPGLIHGTTWFQSVSWEGIIRREFLFCFLSILVPTALMGATFPLVNKIVALGPARIGHSIGRTVAINTTGCIFGPIVAAFLLVPRFGLNNGVLLLALGNIVVGVVLIAMCPSVRSRLKWGGAVAIVLVGSFAYFEFPRNAHYLRAWRNLPGERLLYYSEGLSTVAVHQIPTYASPTGYVKVLEVNGADVAGTDFSLTTTQKMQAHLPLLLHSRPNRVLTVGFGAGGTAWSLRQHPTVQEIDCVELIPDLRKTADYFPEINHNILNDSAVRFIVADGRNYALMTKNNYDVILNDSVHPAFEGNANLYTKEYFELAKKRLNKGGIMASWMPLWRLSKDDLRMILATFNEVFPHTTLWYIVNDINKNLVLIGTEDSLVVDFSKLEERLTIESVRQDLAEVNMDNSFSIVNSLILNEKALDRFVQNARINTDNHPYLEFSAPRAWHLDTETWRDNVAILLDYREPVLPYLTNLGKTENEAVTIEEEMLRYFRVTTHNLNGILYSLQGREKLQEAITEYERALAILPDNKNSLHLLRDAQSVVKRWYLREAMEHQLRRNYEAAITPYKKALKIDPTFLEARNNLAICYLALETYEEAISQVRIGLELSAQGESSAILRNTLANIYIGKGMYEEALSELRKATEESSSLQIRLNLATLYNNLDMDGEAMLELRKVLKMNPDLADAHYYLAKLYIKQGRFGMAASEVKTALKLRPDMEKAKMTLRELENRGY